MTGTPSALSRSLFRQAALALLTTGLVAVACNREAPPPGAEATPTAAQAPPKTPIVVTATASNLVFRYYDPEKRTMAVARQVADIPADARARVLVFDEAGLVAYRAGDPLTVSDLRTPGPDGRFHSELVDPFVLDRERPRTPPNAAPAAPPSSNAAVASGENILFSTDYCPHCRRAREFLKARGVPFVERDVEKDPRARPLLFELGKKAGADPGLLSGVPALWLNGRLLMGFDENAVKRALGLP